jgi:hypothetical protein
LESHSLSLTREELAEFDKQTYKEAHNDYYYYYYYYYYYHYNVNLISDEKTLTIQGLTEAFSKTNEAVDYFKNHDPLLIVLLGFKSAMSCVAVL